jgi:cytochrome P450
MTEPTASLVANAFRAKSLRRWEPDVIAPVCHRLLDAVADDGQADLVRALSPTSLPVTFRPARR